MSRVCITFENSPSPPRVLIGGLIGVCEFADAYYFFSPNPSILQYFRSNPKPLSLKDFCGVSSLQQYVICFRVKLEGFGSLCFHEPVADSRIDLSGSFCFMEIFEIRQSV